MSAVWTGRSSLRPRPGNKAVDTKRKGMFCVLRQVDLHAISSLWQLTSKPSSAAADRTESEDKVYPTAGGILSLKGTIVEEDLYLVPEWSMTSPCFQWRTMYT